jgi:PAS domain-containing protein
MKGCDVNIAYRVVFVGDPAVGHLEFVSDVCAALIGSTGDQIVERPAIWTEAIHPDDLDEFIQTTAQLIASGEPVTRNYRVRSVESDTYRMIEDRLAASFQDDGRVTGYEAVVTLAN